MKGLMKILFGIIGLLVVLIVTAAIVIPMYVDPNDYKDDITALVQKQTGRELQIPGDLSITVFPWLGVQTGRIVLSNAEGFGDEPMVQAEGVEVRVKLLPLLRKEIQMGTVILDRLQANLARNAKGVTNWDDLIKAAEEAPAEPEPEAEEQPALALAGLAVGGLDISDSRVSWDDRQAGVRYVIDDLNLETGELAPGRPIDIDLSMALQASEPELKGTLALAGTVSYDLEKQQYQVTPLSLESSLQGPQLPGGVADISLDADTVAADLGANTASLKSFTLRALETTIEGDIDAQNIDQKLPGLKGYIQAEGDNLPGLLTALGQAELAEKISGDAAKFSLNASFDADAAAGRASVQDLEARLLGVDLSGNLAATNTNTDNPGINGQLTVAGKDLGPLLAVAGQDDLAKSLRALDARANLSGSRRNLKLEPLELTATVAGDAVPEGPVDVSVKATAAANLDEETLQVPQFAVQGLGLDVQGSVNAGGILSEPAFNGALKVAPFNLRKLMQQLAMEVPETADDKVLTKVAVDTKFSGSSNSLSLSGLTLNLDDTTATGSLGVADFEKQALRFNLNVDELNADRYLPPQAEGKAATPETAAAGAALLPVETLRKLNIKGDLKAGQLVISKAKLNNVSLSINAENGVIAIAPVSANLYEGSYQGAVNLDAAGKQPVLKFDTTLASVAIEPLLMDMTGDAKLTGTGNIKAQLTASGADTDAMKKTLNGTADLLFRDGAYKGVNIGAILRKANAILEGRSLQEEPSETQTDFSEMTATLKITDGVVKNDDLAAKSPAIRVNGTGQANLVTEQVDYKVEASVAKTAKGQGGEELQSVGGYTVPVRCKGTFAEPGCKPDFEGLVKARVEREIDKQTDKAKEKVKEKIQDKIGEELGDKFKDTFGF